MVRTIKPILALTLLVPSLGGARCYRTEPGNEPTVAAVSFVPVDGSWSIQSVSRPSNSIQFGDTERFRVTLTGINSPGPQTRRLQIRAGSTNIGIIEIAFPGGTAPPTFLYRANEGANTTPIGAVDLTNGEFWLGCTSPNRYLRGNAARTSSTQSSVHVQLAWQHSTASASHTINCV